MQNKAFYMLKVLIKWPSVLTAVLCGKVQMFCVCSGFAIISLCSCLKDYSMLRILAKGHYYLLTPLLIISIQQ